ncbi:unnamed protein product [Clavelina lepadiformis]|uniref:Uncharacterized protein n=1 Tax=Clavelina lepadiformis TaxID=159417 RepID=A0ABP0GHM4_CLALP
MLEPHNVGTEANLEQRQPMQKKHYDRGTKPLPELQKGDVVYYNRNRRRAKGIITNQRSEPRSYQLQNEYGDIRRNRRQLYKTVQAQPEFQFEHYEDNDNTRSFDDNMNTQVTRPCSFANDITDVRDANVRISRRPPCRYNENITPITFFSSKGFQGELAEKLGVSLERHEIRKMVLKAATDQKNALKEDLSDKFVFLKMDGCTKLRVHYLAINVQLVNSKNMLDIRTLAVRDSTAQQ